MASAATLRYDAVSPQTRLRWDNLLNSGRRQITERMRRLLTIALDACDAVGPPSMQARLIGGETLWILCPQADLAKLLQCSDRTLRSEFERLETLQALCTVPHKSIPNLIAYRIQLSALESLEESRTPELDEIIFEFMDSESATVSATISGGISATISGPVSGGISGPVSALMNHDHEGLNEFNNHSSITHESHEAQQSANPVRFDAISETHVRAIAGFAVTVGSRTGTLSEPRRVTWARDYFRDAVAAGHALPDEFPVFLALFRHVGRRTDVKFRAKYLRKVWTNRGEQPLNDVLSAADRQYARVLIASIPQPETPVITKGERHGVSHPMTELMQQHSIQGVNDDAF